MTLTTSDHSPEIIREFPEQRWLFADFLESIYLGTAPVVTESDVFRVNEIVLLAREAGDRHQIVRL